MMTLQQSPSLLYTIPCLLTNSLIVLINIIRYSTFSCFCRQIAMEQLEKQQSTKKIKMVVVEDAVKQESGLQEQQELSGEFFRKTHSTEAKPILKSGEEKVQRVEFKVEKKQVVKGLFKSLKRNIQPGITIGRAQRQPKRQTNDISPCSYEAKKLQSVHAVKFPQAIFHSSINDKSLPGPGSYHKKYQPEDRKQGQYTIGWKYGSIFDTINKIPGPGTYENPTQDLLKSKSKAAIINKGFGTSSRFKDGEISPGPGDYQNFHQSQASINKKRTISNVGREQSKKSETIPGPGVYDSISYFEDSLKKNRGMSIGSGSINRSSVPDLTKESYNKYTIPREFDSQNAGVGFSIGRQKRKFIELSTTPSPQDYDAIGAYPHSPSARVSQAKSKQIGKTTIPGPGTYEKNLKESSVQYSFSKSKSISQMKIKNQLPGIGKYNINRDISGKGSSFSKQKKMKEEHKNPIGVGDYDLIDQNLTKKGYTIPKAPIHH